MIPASLYYDQIAAAARALRLTRSAGYTWFGRPGSPLPSAIRRALTTAAIRQYLQYQLQIQLYQDFYCPGGAMSSPVARPPFRKGRTPFMARLQSANVGQGCWEPGWQVQAVARDEIVVARQGLALRVPQPAVRAPGQSREPGQAVEVHWPPHLLSLSPGFYLALSEAPLAPDAPLVRLYWHLDPTGAILLLRLTTRHLNRAGVPFRMKVVSDPARYGRCDAGVLYLAQGDYEAVAPFLVDFYRRLAPHLQPAVPALTRLLAPGFGLAEDPGGGESFGLHRCGLVAEGLVSAAGARTVAARVRAVADRFAQAGLDLARPYLEPGAADHYTLPLPGRAPGHRPRRAPAPAAPLTLALDLARRLTRTAIWHNDMCNWIGATPRIEATGHPLYQAAPPTLYDGTAGIALFLAAVDNLVSDRESHVTARGAIRQALAHMEQLPPEQQGAFYNGGIGVAWAAVRVGQLLQDSSLIEQAGTWLETVPARSCPREHDLLAGQAGAMMGLLDLADQLGNPALIAGARGLGDRLLTAAQPDAAGLAWPTAAIRVRRSLTGLAHGAAGIGLALLELARATGEPRYQQAAVAAFAYEQHWFDPATGNWPDFRLQQPKRALYWCHGAPGIALSRLRAYQITGDPAYTAQAQAALAATRAALCAGLTAPFLGDFSLCHGLTGLAEILWIGSQMQPDPANDDEPLICQLEASIARRYGRSGMDDTINNSPSLFLGLAGVGYFCLRRQKPDLDSVLLPK